MKRLQFVLHLCFAALLVVSTTVLPHHHHGRMACMVVERCMQDGHVNDRHTGHDASDSQGEDPCTVCTSQAVVSTSSRHQGASAPSLLPVALYADFETVPKVFGRYHHFVGVSYSSALMRQAHTPAALRAPPVLS